MSYEKFGKDIEIVLKAVKTARKVGATDEFWSLLSSEEKMRKVAEFLFPEHLVVPVDYDSDLMNIFPKKFVLTDQSKEKLTLIRGERKREAKVKVSMKIIHRGYPSDYYLGEQMNTDDALSAMKKVRCRPAIINELQALGEKYPGLQHEFDIVALGSVYSLFTPGEGEELYVPVLSSEKGEPKIKLESLSFHRNYDWKGNFRFASVSLIS